MVKRYAVALCLVVLGASVAMGQNARLNAVGGFSLFGDISDILVNPAYMSDYKNVLQGTYDGPGAGTEGGLGPVIGVKSLGDMVSVGFSYEPAPYRATQAVPHLLVGVGSETWSTGLELFYERDWTHDYGADVVPPAPKAIDENEDITSYMGLAAGFNLNLDALRLAIQLHAGLPYDKTYTYTETAPDTHNETTVKLKSTIDLGGYVEGGFDIGDFATTVGVYMGVSLYGKTETEASTTVGGVTTDTSFEGGTDDFDMNLGLYGGVVKEFDGTGIKVGAQLDAGWVMTRTQPIDDPMLSTNYNPGKEWTNGLGLLTRLAIEKEWSALKRLDAITGRSGIAYGIYESIDHEEGDTANFSHEYREKNLAQRYPDGITWDLGMGIRKGILTVDVDVSPTALVEALNWANGTFAAQDIASLTVTLDFKAIGKSSRGSSRSAPASEPAPAPATDSGLPF